MTPGGIVFSGMRLSQSTGGQVDLPGADPAWGPGPVIRVVLLTELHLKHTPDFVPSPSPSGLSPHLSSWVSAQASPGGRRRVGFL